MVNQDPTNPSHALFDQFVQTQTCKEVQRTFSELCHHLQLDPRDYQRFYTKLKERLNYWKAKALWIKLDKRAQHQDYQQGKVCAKTKCLVLGAGPCGLRTAIELALLGVQVVVLEKRDSFSRNNVLHLWPYTIYDLRGLAAKKFYGKFCTGALDHISIRQLQLILLKVSLLLGVDVNTGVEFKGFVEPSEATGWMAKLFPDDHPAGKFQFDVFISAGGGRFVPDGFRWKELRGKLAIGITCNFINHHSAAEAQVAEISGVARIYNQKFFQDLLTEKGIDLENIVYYKDATHYFVMTAKKKSLLKMGVIKQDFSDANQLLGQANVDQDALLRYAHGAAHFSTGHRLPNMQFALNHAGQPDVAMFDFTCMHRAENASLVRERKGKKLLMGLVGDCLVEPFWPLGTGIARGFLAAFDTAWMVRSWGKGKPHLEVIAERESIYQLLSQTTPENISKNYSAFSIDPTTRYQHVNLNSIKANQLQHLYDVEDHIDLGRPTKKQKGMLSHLRQDSVGAFEELLKWCQQHTAGYDRVKVKDLTQSWRSGLALCALINTFRPHLIDMSSLKESDSVHNNQLAFSLLEEELGIPPIISASDMATKEQIDKLSMVLYLTQIHDAFNERTPTRAEPPSLLLTPSKTLSFQAVFFLNKLKHNSLQRRKERLAAETEEKDKRMRMGDEEDPVAPLAAPEVTPDPELSPTSMNNEECYFCGQRVYVLERISTEGKFFHRSCFTCQQCGTTLRLGRYTFSQHTGKFYCDLHSEQLEIENREQSPSVKDNIGDHEEEKGVNSITSEDPSPCPSEDDEYYLDSGPPKPMEPLHPPSQEDPSSKQPNPVEEPPVSPKPPIDIFIKKGFEDCEVEEEGKEGGEDAPSDPLTPVPKPRQARSAIPNPQTSPPVPKPRTVLLTPKRDTSPAHVGEKGSSRAAGEKGTPKAAPDSRPKPSLRKLQLTDEEKNHLVNLSFSLDSDSETPGSSSCSSSSATAGGPCPPKPPGADGQEEEGYWSGGPGAGGHIREHRNRRCFRRKEEPAEGQGQHARVRSKFSPWNLSSPRLGRDQRFSVLNSHPEVHHGHSVSEEDGADDDDDDDEEDELDMFAPDGLDLYDDKFQTIPSDPVEAEKLELLKMRTLDRRAKTCEMQRFHKAQSIQRRLEEIEVTFKELEDKGVVLEQVLRGEEGSGGSPEMIDQWIHLVHQKNALVSEESDLMVASRQLELEDKQSMLEMELRQYMELDDSEKTAEQQGEEDRVLQEMLEVVDMRNSLVSFLDEKRLKEIESDKQQAISLLEAKRHSTASAGAQVHWA
ncbi:F-actin-monooxygenase mical1-like isoform X1 [Salvelinus namaycush]|uniref:Molecule interacting with CasL protein 1 n=1 Tax=Salvelinus namaycush TaxID=8040 RepID=A0A8U1EYR0_SALNM|nr:F-actin-monooxygenase mical1-like isoform X1 [Salvelinus namaycush]